MYAVKEYEIESGDFISYTPFLNRKESLDFAKIIVERQPYLRCQIFEIGYEEDEKLSETKVWDSKEI